MENIWKRGMNYFVVFRFFSKSGTPLQNKPPCFPLITQWLASTYTTIFLYKCHIYIYSHEYHAILHVRVYLFIIFYHYKKQKLKTCREILVRYLMVSTIS